MLLLAYGEDALTLWALTHRIADFLGALGDPSDAEDAVALYRPSFGRRGAAAGRRSAQFGEFDAIVGTPHGVYLVESKWSRSGEVEGDVLRLREEQGWRHEVMRWYLDRWRRKPWRGWAEFAAAVGPELRARFDSVEVAPVGSRLAANLEYVLRRLAGAGGAVHDVLLFACEPGAASPARVEPAGFRLVCLEYPRAGGAGFVDLSVVNDPARRAGAAV